MSYTLPTAAGSTTEYEDFYETTLKAPLAPNDQDIYVNNMPDSAAGFLVIDPDGATPETIFFNYKGADFVRVPSITDGQGRGVGSTTPGTYEQGTKIGMYSIAAFFEGIANGQLMRDGFLQSRHFSAAVNPNSWIGTGESWNYVGNNGQKEYQYVVSGDKTTKYAAGMKIQLPRITAVGTQSGSFAAASSQYAVKTSPSGITFTGTWTAEAMIYLNSYAASGMDIISKDQGSNSGFGFELNNSGQLFAFWRNGSGASSFVTNQPIPLKQWVHVAVVVTSVSSPAALFYVNGVVTPSFTQGATATTLVQGGNLAVGARAATPSSFFDGYVSEARIWSQAQSAASILSNMNKQLTGSETGLVAYFKLNGNFNDSSPNSNNLTAQAGATATYADNPFKSTEYGIITGLDYAVGNTTVTAYFGNKHNAPAENLTGVAYSGTKAPAGFPGDPVNWTVSAIDINMAQKSSPTLNTWYGGTGLSATGLSALIPRGAWRLGWEASVYGANSGGATHGASYSLSTSSNSESDSEFTYQSQASWASGYTLIVPAKKEKNVTVNAATTYYVIARATSGSETNVGFQGSTGGPTVIRAVCAYL